MPETLSGATFAVVLFGILLAVSALALRRWGTDDVPDTLMVLWRRWASLGRPSFATAPDEAEPMSAPVEREPEPAEPEPAAEHAEPEPAPASGPRESRRARRRRERAERLDEAWEPEPGDAVGEFEPWPEEEPEPLDAPEPRAGPDMVDEPDDEEPDPVDEPKKLSRRERRRAKRREREGAAATEAAIVLPDDELDVPDDDVDEGLGDDDEIEAPAAVDEAPEPVPDAAPVAELRDDPRPRARSERAARTRAPAKLDYVPIGVIDVAEPQDDAERARFRDRFRRGLRKTREFLARDVGEVFGAGPLPQSFDALEELLVRADVGVLTATAVVDELRERGGDLNSDTLPPALKSSMRALLSESDRRLHLQVGGLAVWLVVGVNGTGKTTTIAKLAALASSHGLQVSLAAADTFRAAAVEQLETWANRIGVDVTRQGAGADPGAVVFDALAHAKAAGHDLLIVDTAGRLHTRKPLMEELRKIKRIVDRDGTPITECLLVLDATTGQNGIAQARAFGEAVDVTGLVLAKLDGTAKGGIAFAVERELGVPVKAVGVGEKAADLAPFDPDAYVEAMLG